MKAPKTATVTLDEPIERGEQTIGFLELRQPRAGELRGLSLADVATMKGDALVALLPRITNPALLPEEAAQLGAADLFAIGIEVAGFFLPSGMHPDKLATPAIQ